MRNADLGDIKILPVSFGIAKSLITKHHYLHSFPGGTQLCLGVFKLAELLGAITFGVGPQLAYHLVKDAHPEDCLTLTRYWISDSLPPNSESRVLGLTLKALKADTQLKFLITYADPSSGHIGAIYQASNWIYTGLSQGTPLYDLGNGMIYHSRSLGQILGSHSLIYWQEKGISIKRIAQSPKFRYLYFLDPAWRSRLTVPVLPYPKEVNHGNLSSALRATPGGALEP